MTSNQHEDTRGQTAAGVVPPLDDDRWNDVAVQLGDLARALNDQQNAQETLEEIVRTAVALIPGAEHAGIMMVVGKREVHTVAMDVDLVAEVDKIQFDTGQGPCLDALYEHRTVTVPELATERRWPRFAERAAGLGVGSMLSFQLYVAGDDLGGLNLYAAEPGAFDEESQQVGLLFAAHAAVALANAKEQEHLTQAVHTRDVIGQAKGILMERYKINSEQAFTLLVRTSQNANVKLRDLADRLIHTGELKP